MQQLPGFKSLETHHCITGSMRHAYAYHDHDVSKDMLLGIGGGVGGHARLSAVHPMAL